MAAIETVTSPRHPSPADRVHRLLVVYSPEAGQVGRSAFLGVEAIVVGRAPPHGPGLELDDPEVSRAHAELRLVEGSGATLRDCGSRNGTFVNGARLIDTRELTAGDVIRVGAHVLLYQVLEEADCRHLLDPIPQSTTLFGTSAKIARVRHAIRMASSGAMPALIIGETGVGKELVAQAIHRESGREGAFVALNCGALPEALVESELFGHVGGAFTGAHQRQGLFFRARGGTLFLDEIGEMDLSLQKRLLRVLSTGEARPVGSDQAKRVDTRVVSATNVDLDAAVERGAFRGDLYARLAGHVIPVPPLHHRREDVLALSHHFLRIRRLQAALTADAAEALLVYSWPFNVRELEQMIGALEPVLKAEKKLSLDVLPEKVAALLGDRRRFSSPKKPPLTVLGIRRSSVPSKEELVLLLELHRGNVSQVAAFFGKGRRQVYRWAKDLGVDVGAVRTNAVGPSDDSDADEGQPR